MGRAEETADGIALMFSLALAFEAAGSAGSGELSALSCEDLESETDLLPVASERGADR